MSLAFFPAQSAEFSAIGQVYVINASDTLTYQEQGTGILRHEDNGVGIGQVMIRGQMDITNSFFVDVVGNYYQDGEKLLGLTQAQLLYKPLSNDEVRFKGRAGFFYPRISLENVDEGWLSPYIYTQSAVNSWIGEELRTAGLELSIYSPGRARRSPWSWEVTASAFKGNDPLGTLLSWRGFAMHDRQSLHNDKARFAPYPTVIDPSIIWHPDYVEPFHELDGRLGFYLGGHLNHFNRSQLRYYYYDNRADPLELNEQRLYAWRTKFHSLSAQHNITQQTRVISQWMSGSSVMGDHFVAINFDAWYLMLSHRVDEHRFSVRYDKFSVRENDAIPADINSSHGFGFTLAWRYDINQNWQLGIEHHTNENTAYNRVTLGLPVERDQSQSQFVAQFRW